MFLIHKSGERSSLVQRTHSAYRINLTENYAHPPINPIPNSKPSHPAFRNAKKDIFNQSASSEEPARISGALRCGESLGSSDLNAGLGLSRLPSEPNPTELTLLCLL